VDLEVRLLVVSGPHTGWAESARGAAAGRAANGAGSIERSARAHLRKQGESLASRGVAWRGEVVYGVREREVARYAAGGGADLVVLTAPRFDPAHPAAGLGSLSFRVGVLAPCPVLLVK
jgi:nucleotide-binding universal stress UspA family protein